MYVPGTCWNFISIDLPARFPRAGCDLAPQRKTGPVGHQCIGRWRCFQVGIAERNEYFHEGVPLIGGWATGCPGEMTAECPNCGGGMLKYGAPGEHEKVVASRHLA